MNSTAQIAGIVAMTAVAAMAAENHAEMTRMERTVPVCVEGIGSDVLAQAEPIASKMFLSIGVTIEWRLQGRHCPPLAIQISLSDRTPATMLPGALAYAVPGQGTQIRLFYDRISEYHEPKLVRCLLAHVLVHEITHILQGVCRHSDHGVMKAHWEQKDYADMIWATLPFADEDIDLIYSGLLTRTTRAMMAANAAPAVAVRQ